MIHIMMATYNGEKYLCEQIESILNQTYTEWKLYIRDDGSCDHTIEIIDQYTKKYPEQIIQLHSESEMHGAKYNFLYLYKEIPKAEYYAFCDQDDIWGKNKLQRLLEIVEKYDENEMLLIYHDMKLGKDRRSVLDIGYFEYSKMNIDEKHPLQQALLYNVIPGCAMFFNHTLKNIVEEIPEACFMHDWWITLSTIYNGGKIVFCSDKLSLYRQHQDNEIGAVKKMDVRYVLRKAYKLFSLKDYYRNNKEMKDLRNEQGKKLLYTFSSVKGENKRILNIFLETFKGKNKISAYINCRKAGFVFYNEIYTFKFFVM